MSCGFIALAWTGIALATLAALALIARGIASPGAGGLC